MSHSQNREYTLTCKKCQQEFSREIWRVVDVIERPDLYEKIKDSSIRVVECFNCGFKNVLDFPLLVFQPDRYFSFIFVPATKATEEQNQEALRELSHALRLAIGEKWQSDWNELPLPSLLLSQVAIFREKAALETREFRSLPAASNIPAGLQSEFLEAEFAIREYQRTGEIAAIDRAIAAWDIILQSFAFQGIDLNFQLALIGRAWWTSMTRFEAQSRLEDLDQALNWIQNAVDLIPSGFRDQAEWLNSLGIMLSLRYEYSSDLADLERALQAAQQAVNLTPKNSPNYAKCLITLSTVWTDLYKHSSDPADLEKAIQAVQQAVDLTPQDSPDKASFLDKLGQRLADRYSQSGDLADLERALQAAQQAVNLTPKNSPDMAGFLNSLSIILSIGYERSSDSTILDQAIQTAQKAVDLTHRGSPQKALFLNNLGQRLADLYKHSSDPADLEKAIQAVQQAVDLTPQDSPDKASFLDKLGQRLADRYSQSGDLADLERALQAAQQAVNLTPQSSPNKAWYLYNLGNRLADNYKQSGDPADLEKAIRATQQAVDLVHQGSPNKARYLYTLSNRLADNYKQSGDPANMDQAIQVAKQAVDLMSQSSPDKARFLINLGQRLADRYELAGDPADLEQALQIAQEASDLTPQGSTDKATFAASYNRILTAQYQRFGRMVDLEKAIQAAQQAVDLAPQNSPNRAGLFNNLSVWFARRYQRSGDLVDLEQAIKAAQQAVNLTTQASLDEKTMILTNLSNHLADRYERFGDLVDLEQSIQAAQQAVDLTPPGSPNKATSLTNLGNRLAVHYELSGDPADLEQAIRAAQQAVDLTPDGSPDKAKWLINLSNKLAIRSNLSIDLADLEQAIESNQQALELISEEQPLNARAFFNLGKILSERYRRLGDQADLENGLRSYEKAVELAKNGDPEALIKASRAWGSWSLERKSWEEAARAFKPGLETIGELVRQHALRTSKEAWLREARGISDSYAFALARSGKLAQALEAIETGRARLLSEQLSLVNIDLNVLMYVAPNLVHKYEELTAQARQWRASELQKTKDVDQVRSELSQINQELSLLTEQIRTVKGFEHFLAPVTVRDIYQAAKKNPIAYIAATPAGGMALLALPGRKAEVMWFDKLTRDRLFGQMDGSYQDPAQGGYLVAYYEWKDSLHSKSGVSVEEKKTAFNNWLNALDDTTQWLWDACMGELTGWLADRGYSCCALVPTGLFTLLPLHAAWTQDSTTPTGRRYALDNILFTYTPNALALMSAQNKAGRPADRILLVENPNADIPQRDIPYSPEVSQTAMEYFAADQTLYLPGGQALQKTVLDGLTDANVLHFWTHGLSVPQEPLDSSLLMAHEEQLTLKDILPLALPNARLALLAACETGVAGIRNIDEVVSLPSGFLQAGVPGVVGSLWSVTAVSTMMLVSMFYEIWQRKRRFYEILRRKRNLSPLEALVAAQIWVRDSTNQEKERYYQHWIEKVEQSGKLMMPAEAARVALHEMMIKSQEALSFSHPFFWAGFVYFGV